MVEIRWTKDSLIDLKEIRDYIARDSSEMADSFIRNIIKNTKKLERLPYSGRIVPTKNIDTLREILYKNYRIIYEIFPDYIEIITIFHQMRILRF